VNVAATGMERSGWLRDDQRHYLFKLKALSATEGESARTTVRLHDGPVKPVRKVRG
jgi:hypothetical protein